MKINSFNSIVMDRFQILQTTCNKIRINHEAFIKVLANFLDTENDSAVYIKDEFFKLFKSSKESSKKLLDISKKIEVIIRDNLFSIEFSSTIFFETKIAELENLVGVIDGQADEVSHNFENLSNNFYFYLKEKSTNLNLAEMVRDGAADLNILNIEFDKNLKNTLNNLDELLLSINAEKYNFTDFLEQSYKKKFIEESELLLKKIENSSNKILGNFAHEFRKIESENSNLRNSFDIIKQNFTDSEMQNNKLKEDFSSYEKRLNQIVQSRTEDIDYLLNDKLEKLDIKCNEKLIAIDSSYQDAKNNYELFTNLVENAGIYKLTENYKTKADEEKKEYTTYRKHTTQAIIAAIVSTLAIFVIAFLEHLFSTTKTDTNFLLLASRLSISVMFFVLAFYLSKQAAKHYECYQENHRTFLQLAALEPFMARMSHDEQKEIRKGLIPSYFNQSVDGKFAAKGDEVDISMMFTFMDKLSNFAQGKKDTKPAETPATEPKP